LDQIARLRNDKAIKAALESLPPGLTETYERILDGIVTEDRQLALRIIRWLVCSYRPMHIQELIEAIAIELDAVRFEADTLLNDPEDLLDICGSLIACDQDRGTVGLAHFSVKEFFVSRERLVTSHNDFFVDIVQTNFELAQFCVTYLCYEDFSEGPCPSSQELLCRAETYSLFLYSSLYWPEHARGHVSMEDQSFLLVMERFFLSPQMKPNFLAWMQAHKGLRDDHPINLLSTSHDFYLYTDVKGDSRLIHACRLGLYSVAKLLLSRGSDPNTVCTSEPPIRNSVVCFAYGHALHAACQSRDLNMVKLIFEAGGDVNAIAGQSGLPICAAIDFAPNGNFDIFEYLLDKGADINLVTAKKKWALRTALGCNNINAIKACLRAGADLNFCDDDGQTVLESAAITGKEGIFSLLLEHGAGGGKYINEIFLQEFALEPSSVLEGYALFLASQNNFFEAAEKILQNAGDAFFRDSSFALLLDSTFKSCARKGLYRFMENMLKYSGDNWQFPCHTECLRRACSQGYSRTAKILLTTKNVNPSPKMLTDLLVLCAGRGYRSVVELLVEYGAVPENPDQHGWTALLAASVHQQQTVIDLLNQQNNTEGGLDVNVLKPTSWREWITRGDEIEAHRARLKCTGLEAHIPPDGTRTFLSEVAAKIANVSSGDQAWIATDHPLPISDKYRYFEVQILSIGQSEYGPSILASKTTTLTRPPTQNKYRPLLGPLLSRCLSLSSILQLLRLRA
jgi:ankyrin repeat protein